MKRLKALALVLLLVAFGYAGSARGQFSVQPFSVSTCNAAAICCQVALPTFTYVKPGGVATTGTTSITLFRSHVSNSTGAAVYAQLFNIVGTPAAATTPTAASSWNIPTISDRDFAVSDSPFGMVFNTGLTMCCSTTQGTFTAAAAGACGFLLEYR